MQNSSDLLAQIETIERDERELVFTNLNSNKAFAIGSEIRDAFLKTNTDEKDGIVISISLFSGHILFQCAIGNPRKVGPDNWDWVRRKTNTVKRFGLSSYLVGRQLLNKGKDINSLGPEYAAHGGAFPINIKDVNVGPIGVVVVSGLTQELDHKIIVDTLRKHL